MKTFFVQVGKRRAEVMAADRGEARWLALAELFGKGAFWDADYDPRYGRVFLQRERRGNKLRFVEKPVTGRCRIEVSER